MTERIFHLNSSDNLISRLSASSLQENSLSSVQQRIDTAVSQFSRGMTDGNVLAAMTVGSIAYRITQIGVLSLGSGTAFSSIFLKPTAAALGLFNEVVAFEGTSRLFQSYSQSSHGNLWSLRGEGGWLQSLPVSLLHFATLKMGGALGQGSNLIVQHALASGSMVLGHQMTGFIGLTAMPEGDLLEQWVHAEIMNLQLSLGASLVHGIFPSLASFERSLQLSSSISDTSWRAPSSERVFQEMISTPVLVTNAQGLKIPHVMMNSGNRESRGFGGRPKMVSSPPEIISRRSSLPERSRSEVRKDLESLTQELEAEYHRYLESIEEMRVLLSDRNNDATLWNQFSSLLAVHNYVSREYQMGGSALESKGGAEKWAIARLEGMLESMRHARDHARQIYREINLPTLPSVEIVRDAMHVNRFDEILITLRTVGLDSSLIKQVRRLIQGEDRDNYHVRLGLQGLHGLLYQKGRDETLAVGRLLHLILERQDRESFDQLLYRVTSNFQVGALSRAQTMEMIRACRDFYEAYPNARGGFVELFAHSHFAGTRESNEKIEAALHFSRSHLEEGSAVYLEARNTYGDTFIRVENEGRVMRYAVSAVHETVRDEIGFRMYASRLLRELIRMRAENPVRSEEGIYLEFLRLKEVDPIRLRLWMRRLMEVGESEVIQEMLEDMTREAFLRRSQQDRSSVLYKQIRTEVEAFWNSFRFGIQQIEVAFLDARGKHQVERATFEDPGTTDMIEGLRQAVRNPHLNDRDKTQAILLLGQSLKDLGHDREALSILRQGLALPPVAKNSKILRDLYRQVFQSQSQNLFKQQRERSVLDQEVIDFLNSSFQVSLSREALDQILELNHPQFRFAPITIESHVGGLRVHLSVESKDAPHENVAEFTLDLNIPHDESTFAGYLLRSRVKSEYQNQRIATHVFAVVTKFLRALSFEDLRFEAEDIGRYTWLRLGAEFAKPEEQIRFRAYLRSFISDRPEFKKWQHLTDSHFTADTIRQIITSMPVSARNDFLNFFQGHVLYRFDLRKNSPNFKIFQRYFSRRTL